MERHPDIPQKLLARGKVTVRSPVMVLLQFMSQYIYHFGSLVTYGQKTPTRTQFYINTMEASHNENSLRSMSELILNLVSKKLPDRPRPDFVLTPKQGNPMLGQRCSDTLKIPCILRKSGSDKSRIGIDPTDFMNRLIINFEGSMPLVEAAKLAAEQLTGIVVDCNASGGSEILSTMEEFNNIIQNLHINIAPVTNAFVLFRPDNQDDIDTEFKNHNYTIYRYLDLTEAEKEKLYSLKNHNLNRKREKIAVGSLITTLLKDKRLNPKVLDGEDLQYLQTERAVLPLPSQPPEDMTSNVTSEPAYSKTRGNTNAGR